MTKKDYIAIARTLQAAANKPDGALDWDALPGVRKVAALFADVLAADNPRFDRCRFLNACLSGMPADIAGKALGS